MVQIVSFVSNLSNFEKNGKLLIHLDYFYCIVQLFCSVLVKDTGNGPISTHDTVKFINFRSIIYRFEIKSIL